VIVLVIVAAIRARIAMLVFFAAQQ